MTDVYQPQPQPSPVAAGPVGQVRGTGMCILLLIVTLGIYSLVYYYKTHDEMKQQSGQGLGGGLALVLGLFVSIVLVFTMPGEVGKLRERAGQDPKVSAMTGLWILLPLLGGIVWFVKTNGALNEYWQSQGATA
jgi:hypothetical protein